VFQLLASIRVTLAKYPNILKRLVRYSKEKAKPFAAFPDPNPHMRNVQMHKYFASVTHEGMRLLYASAIDIGLVPQVFQILFAHGIKHSIETLNVADLELYVGLSKSLLGESFIHSVIIEYLGAYSVIRYAINADSAKALREKYSNMVIYVFEHFPGIRALLFPTKVGKTTINGVQLLANASIKLFEYIKSHNLQVDPDCLTEFFSQIAATQFRGESPVGVFYIVDLDLMDHLKQEGFNLNPIYDVVYTAAFEGMKKNDHNSFFFKYIRALFINIEGNFSEFLDRVEKVLGVVFYEIFASMHPNAIESLVSSILKRNNDDQLPLTESLSRVKLLFEKINYHWPPSYTKSIIMKMKDMTRSSERPLKSSARS
jgi:hypothetical protein